MTQSEKSQGQAVPDSATDMQRRQFLKSSAAAGALT
ncbi:MAG: twin-arginine translocation signal domain-containing protein, partial [gamma proteobacterium symbiont of Ctena orbiculata]